MLKNDHERAICEFVRNWPSVAKESALVAWPNRAAARIRIQPANSLQEDSMTHRIVVALVLVGLGWAAARAQAPAVPDFELSVTSQEGKTTIECLRGCGLQWVERQVPNRTEAQKSFT